MNAGLATRIQDAVAAIYPDIQRSLDDQPRPFTEEELWYEFSCCVLSSQVPFNLAVAVADRLCASRVLLSEELRQRSEIERDINAILRGAFKVDGKMRRYRFPSIKAAQLAASKYIITVSFGGLGNVLTRHADVEETRRWFVENAPGVGPKQASMFLRNLGVSYEIAILDRHILTYMSLVGLCDRGLTVASYKNYKSYEARLKNHAHSLGYTLGLFDWALWIVMRVLGDLPKLRGEAA